MILGKAIGDGQGFIKELHSIDIVELSKMPCTESLWKSVCLRPWKMCNKFRKLGSVERKWESGKLRAGLAEGGEDLDD